MKKYNSFILEQIKEITNDAATDYLNNLIGYKPENSIFYRSDEKLYGEFYLIKTHKRESRTRNNLQNIILSQYDYMPDRIKSISFSTFDVAKSFGDEFNLLNHIYQLIPENNVKIVICPNKDLNKYPAYKIVQEFFKVVDFNWNKMEDATFRKQFENKECYFDGTCLLKLID